MKKDYIALDDHEAVEEYAEQNWDHYTEWLAEHIGYAGGAKDWDSFDTRFEYAEQNISRFDNFAFNYNESRLEESEDTKNRRDEK